MTDPLWIVLVNPGFPVSTAWAYQQVQLGTNPKKDEYGKLVELPIEFQLTKDIDHNKIPPHPALRVQSGLLRIYPRNDLMEGVVHGYPEVERMIKSLEACGSGLAMMSGSGPTCYGLFNDLETARSACRGMEQMGWRTWVVQCLNRSPYSI
jgi:4-diphosphocytidyl-2-C-methyl-D-erythritol kinase